jgi:phospholipid/cholesterol/gamma-HCH transport system substrate-binding protein
LKPAWNRALAVGVLAAVTGVAFLLALTFFRKGGYSERQSYLVHAYFSDATGLSWKSRVQIAGIQIGEVVNITLEGAKARLDIRVKNEIDLHADACVTKTFPSALLPDALLEAVPGSAEQPLLKALPVEERRITCVREATSVQQLLDSMARIAQDVQLVTGDLAETVAGDRGLREIVENLASATRRVDEAIAQNQENLAGILANARDFTGDLREISRRDKDKIGRIATNVELLTARLNIVAASLQEIIDPGSSGPSGAAPRGGSRDPGTRGNPGGSAGAPRIDRSDAYVRAESAEDAAAAAEAAAASARAQALAGATPEERVVAIEQARGVRQAVEKLTDSLDNLDYLISRVNEGKSVAGRLLVDERLGRKLGVAAEDLADQLDKIFKLQVQLQLRSEWLLNQTLQNDGRPGTKLYFGVRLLPRPDKYYLLELVSDPRGVDTVTTESISTRLPDGSSAQTISTRKLNEDKLTFSLQIAKRYGPATFRIGIIEGSGGAGADLHLLRDKLQLSASMYQFSRAFQEERLSGSSNVLYPRAKVWLNYYFLENFFVTTGADDFLNRWEQGNYPGGRSFNIGTDVFFGLGVFFTDDDLKTLLGAGAGSAVPTGG